MKTTALSLFTLLLSFSSVFGQTRKDSLIVFIGEKIEVKYSPKEEKEGVISMDSRYVAKYKILQLIHGSYQQDTIQFTVYDHYGKPAFSNYRNVLLFVNNYGGKLYHEKYQYFALYLTTDNKWASPYSGWDYVHPYQRDITVKPEKIRFKEEVSFPVHKFPPDELKSRYPEPYYEIKDGKAIAVYGNYVDDLFKLKQQTVLKARGIY